MLPPKNNRLNRLGDYVRRWFASPVFPDEEKTRRARVLSSAVNLLILVACLVFVGQLAGGKTPVSVVSADIFIILSCLGLRYWLSRGNVTIPSIGLLIVLYVGLIFACAMLGTIRTPTTAGFVILVTLGGLLFGKRGLVVIIIACMFAIAGLMVAENMHLLPAPDYSLTITQWATYAAIFIWVGGLTFIAIGSTQQALARASQELRERERTEEKFRALIEHSSEAITLIDGTGRTIYESPSSVKVTGYSIEEQIGRNSFELIHPDDIDAVQGIFAKLLQSPGDTVYMTPRTLHKDGSYRYFECAATNLLHDPAIQAIVVNFRDATERKYAEEALRESEEKYKSLIENVNVGIFHSTLDGILTFVNPTVVQMSGYSFQELVQHPAQVLYADTSDRDRLVDKLKAKGFVHNEEMQSVRKDGSEYSISMSAVFVKDDAGQPRSILGSVQDITARRATEEKLRESDKRLRFMLQISQSLVTPFELNAVLQMVVDNSTQLLDLDTGALYLLEGDNLFLSATTPPLPSGFPDELRHAVLTYHPHIQAALSSRASVILPDTAASDLTKAEREVSDLRGLRTIIYVPLMVSNRAIGILILGSVNELRTFAEEEVNLCWGFAGQAAQTIENVRLYKTAQEYAADLGKEITERKRVEELLRVQKQDLQKIIEAIPVMLWTATPDGQVDYYNQRWLDFCGIEEEQMLGSGYTEVVHLDDLSRISEAWTKSIQQGTPYEIESRIRQTDGTYAWILSRALPIKDSNGDIVKWYGANVDISKRKRAEEALRENEARFREVMEHSLDAVYKRNLKTDVYDYMSPAITLISGYPLDEVMVMPIATVFHLTHPEDRPRVEQIIAEAMSNPISKDWVMEYRILCKDGRYRWFQDKFVVVRDAQGQPTARIGVVRDATERKHAEEALRASEELYRQMFANHSAIMLLIDPVTGMIVEANSAAVEFYGYSFDILRTMNINQINTLPPDQVANVFQSVSSLVQNEFIFLHRLASGELRDVEVNTVPIQTRGRKLHYAIIHDITARRQAEKRLRYLSTHDSLTGLYNRAFFESESERLEQGREFPVSVIVADIDNLKLTNDTRGHAAGDTLIQRAANAMQAVFRASDILARVGGDEFAAILPNTDASTAEQMLARIRDNLAKLNREHSDVPLSLALGMATIAEGNLIEAFKLADHRMYEDKRGHKQNL